MKFGEYAFSKLVTLCFLGIGGLLVASASAFGPRGGPDYSDVCFVVYPIDSFLADGFISAGTKENHATGKADS